MPPQNQPDPVAETIRAKLNSLYGEEPDAVAELAEAEAEPAANRSAHQRFIHNLSQSGLSGDGIQAKWHEYYANLPDEQKHAVWQEYYAEQHMLANKPQIIRPNNPEAHPTPVPEKPIPKVIGVTNHQTTPAEPVMTEIAAIVNKSRPNVNNIKRRLLANIANRAGKHKTASVNRSIAVLGIGCVALVILFFLFFNQRIVAPLMQPPRRVSTTPIIVDQDPPVTSTESKIIIPKINVEIPVIYDQASVDEKVLQSALEKGTIHYPTTPKPGELGNSVIFGHSSNNIFSRGEFKFAFVLLGRLEIDDTFYLTRGGKRYVYRVYQKKVVPPSEVSVMNSSNRPAEVTLITCDPPGTSTNRLVVVGEQVSPEPSVNVASTAPKDSVKPKKLPSAPPSLWSQLTNRL